MHLRMPSRSHGTISFLWGLFFGLLIWWGMVAIGITGATSFIAGAIAGLGIFLLVRVYGGDEPAQSARRERAS
jgi:steroid 5-alpha reductase family enzyme